MTANRIIQLDHHTRGRVMFGAGPGLLASDALMMGIDPNTQRDRMAEALGAHGEFEERPDGSALYRTEYGGGRELISWVLGLGAEAEVLEPASLREATIAALDTVRTNKMRSGLTILGIVIGVAAVVTMMEIGSGSALAIQETIARMGSNNIMVLPGSMNTGAVNYGTGSRQTLNLQDFEVLVEISLEREHADAERSGHGRSLEARVGDVSHLVRDPVTSRESRGARSQEWPRGRRRASPRRA